MSPALPTAFEKNKDDRIDDDEAPQAIARSLIGHFLPPPSSLTWPCPPCPWCMKRCMSGHAARSKKGSTPKTRAVCSVIRKKAPTARNPHRTHSNGVRHQDR